MKKFLKSQSLTLTALFCGIGMLFLRLSHIATANEHGLLATGHIGGIAASVLALLVPAVLLWQSLVLPKDNICKFPASTPAAIGCGIAALGVGYTAMQILMHGSSNTMYLILGLLGILATIGLVIMAGCRWQGVKTNVLCYAVVVLFFILLLIVQYQGAVMQTQLQLYAYAPVATICLMIATHNRACFDEKIGQVRLFVFFRTVSIFFSLAAMAGSALWGLYLACSIWSIMDLVNLSVTPQEGG